MKRRYEHGGGIASEKVSEQCKVARENFYNFNLMVIPFVLIQININIRSLNKNCINFHFITHQCNNTSDLYSSQFNNESSIVQQDSQKIEKFIAFETKINFTVSDFLLMLVHIFSKKIAGNCREMQWKYWQCI